MTQIPADIASLEDFERHGLPKLEPGVRAYVEGGSGCEDTLRANLSSWSSIGVQSRVLSSQGSFSTQINVLEQSFAHPVFLAPLAYQTLYHPDGEVATAKGAGQSQACMVASSYGGKSLEEIEAAASGPKWFQLYIQPDDGLTRELIARAHAAGFKAIMPTLDVPVLPKSRRAIREGFVRPGADYVANLPNQKGLHVDDAPSPDSQMFKRQMNNAPGWDYLGQLISDCPLPVVLKGITHAGDAKRCLELGAAGIVASNHGGRALDGVPSGMHILMRLREQLGDDPMIMVDGGIRNGGDVFKALALGANAVMVGRPQVHALATAGADGVARMVTILREELEFTMALTGCSSIGDISRACLITPDGHPL